MDVHGAGPEKGIHGEVEIVEEKFGVPVGAVRISRSRVEALRAAFETHLERKIGFRGVEKVDVEERQGHGGDGLSVLVYLPPEAASCITDEAIVSFLQSASATFLPGLRKRQVSKIKREPIRGKPALLNEHKALPDAFTFAEIFAGIGGFRLGLEPLGCRCVFASEICPSACALYARNFGDAELAGDILGLYAHDIPDFDILTGGFPCQTFSNRGEQQGFADQRGQLYLELARLLSAKQPKAFIFENVVGLVLMGGGSRSARIRGKKDVFAAGGLLREILETLEACGYDVGWRVVNARSWVPQQRERVYIVGTRRDLRCAPLDFDALPGAEGDGGDVRGVLEGRESAEAAAAALTEAQWAKVRGAGAGGEGAGRAVAVEGKMQTLTASYHRVGNIASQLLFQEADGSPRLPPRLLTPRECARLMGFPEAFALPRAEDGHAAAAHCYRALGNAVVPPVIRAIGTLLLQLLREAYAGPRTQPPPLQ